MFEIKETFKTKDGFDQLISYVLDDDLDKVLSEDWSYHFSAEGSYDLDGDIVSYEWDFGDGSKGNGPFVIHEYPSEGEYIICLTVTDDDGVESSVEYLLTVSKNES
ncbi:MAG: PKD domain-containing protein [Candidatus Lokiarchaeota archaeon]|nr:PKD domain-containing protein [Candidatus Lokiarchaeota archaeon]